MCAGPPSMGALVVVVDGCGSLHDTHAAVSTMAQLFGRNARTAVRHLCGACSRHATEPVTGAPLDVAAAAAACTVMHYHCARQAARQVAMHNHGCVAREWDEPAHERAR